MARRIAVVDKDKCNPGKCQQECIKFNPHNRAGIEVIKIVDGKAEIDEKLSTDVDQVSAKKCPFQAIHMVKLPEELNQDPIHRYGKNGFALYNVPIPKFGSVVGIVGKNGIGKSTALNILAGIEIPNLNSENNTYEGVIERLKGTEAQNYFEKLKNKELKTAFKPQQVELIPKQFSGTVKDLLEKADEKKELDKIVKTLGLSKLIDRDISKLSGGELQRVAIGATMLKKADVYFFDEPASYLDIKQRMRVSKAIKGLIDDKTAVVLIEHDLIVLDYMTDYTHLLFGEPAVYGIVSHLKPTRSGINAYLEGYLRDENMRFRDKPIKFEETVAAHEGAEQLTEWETFEKKFGNFSLKANAGMMQRHDVIGILGENGIGKTSFVKSLVEKGFDRLSISYKPQYIEVSDKYVAEILQEASSEKIRHTLKPLNLEKLQERKLNELSGGELQRVAIAVCLSQEANIYLLDEPSAYLDVEQRLSLSRMIRDVMHIRGSSALVVDHDLLFLDYITNKILVFEGEAAVRGESNGPFEKNKGMDFFLKDLEITFRRDPESKRPRANKEGSQLDSEQKTTGKYYYNK